MPRLDCLKSSLIERTTRVRQVEGIFDLTQTERSEMHWTATVPIEEREWRIGLIVGPSGSGKSTLARELFGAETFANFDWQSGRSIIDCFPESLGVREITGLLSSVGFSSPPAWLRPFHVLSTGEQFRVTLARAMASTERLTVVDEFTSVVDRTVARIGSAAVAKAIRRKGGTSQFVAVSCHDDIIDWLDPDWIYTPAADEFHWRLERRPRPQIKLEIDRVNRTAWKLFKQHHYLSGELSRSSKCFCAFIEGRPAAFAGVIYRSDTKGGYWAEHRTVCLPDFQGVGIGNAMSEFVASLFVATGRRYCSRTSHPAMIRHRAASPLWVMTCKPGMAGRHNGDATLRRSGSSLRFAASFRFVGPPRLEDAGRFGLLGGPTPQSLKSSSRQRLREALGIGQNPAKRTVSKAALRRLIDG